jgi:iron complex transport system ATP-binding protein
MAEHLPGAGALLEAESSLADGSRQLPAIQYEDVCFSYVKHAKRPFIEGLDLALPHGRVTGIIGPNGCGKSTLLKLADGLLVPGRGRVCIAGKPVHDYRGRERARTLSVLAQAGRVPAMTVEALVACGRFPHQGFDARLSDAEQALVDRALERCGVGQFRAHDMRHLSGGERQRAFLAMTLVQDTDILALDEPTTYLDVHACHEIMQLVRTLNECDKKTVIMVIHDLDLALRYSDYLVVMQAGSVLAQGTVDEVLEARAIEQAFNISVQSNAPSALGSTSYSLFPRI